MSEKQRDKSLDFVRSFATICVVLCHCTENSYSFHIENICKMSTKSQILAFSLFTVGRLGVPLFLILTGYLLLSRDWNREKILSFYKKNLFNLFAVWEVWLVLYELFLCWFNKVPFEILPLIQKMLFIKSVGLEHCWYMPMIIGLYIFIPFYSLALKKIENRHVLLILLVAYFYAFIIPDINRLVSAGFLPKILSSSIQIELTPLGSEYVFYLIIGYLICESESSLRTIVRKHLFICLILFMAIFGLTVFFQIVLNRNGYQYRVWYSSSFLPFLGLLSFIVLREISTIVKNKGLLFAKYSFGIYLLHSVIIKLLKKYIVPNVVILSSHRHIKLSFLFLASIILSLAISIIIGKEKHLKKLLLL